MAFLFKKRHFIVIFVIGTLLVSCDDHSEDIFITKTKELININALIDVDSAFVEVKMFNFTSDPDIYTDKLKTEADKVSFKVEGQVIRAKSKVKDRYYFEQGIFEPNMKVKLQIEKNGKTYSSITKIPPRLKIETRSSDTSGYFYNIDILFNAI